MQGQPRRAIRRLGKRTGVQEHRRRAKLDPHRQRHQHQRRHRDGTRAPRESGHRLVRRQPQYLQVHRRRQLLATHADQQQPELPCHLPTPRQPGPGAPGHGKGPLPLHQRRQRLVPALQPEMLGPGSQDRRPEHPFPAQEQPQHQTLRVPQIHGPGPKLDPRHQRLDQPGPEQQL